MPDPIELVPKSSKQQDSEPEIQVVSRKRIEQQSIYEDTNHLLADDDVTKTREGVDLDLMVFNIERKNTRKFKCLELLIFIPFLIFATMYLFFSQHVTGGYWMHFGIKDLFVDEEYPPTTTYGPVKIKKNFLDVNTPEEYFQWAEGVLIPGLFNEQAYNDAPLPSNLFRYIQLQNKLVGSLRIRQQRAKAGCVKIQRFAPPQPDFDGNCYSPMGGAFPYSWSRTNEEETEKAFPEAAPSNRSYWKWGNCNAIGGGSTYFGKYLTLPCSGYTTFIPFNTSLNDAKTAMAFLRTNGWIDKQTRSIFHEFFSYNPTLNYFTSTKLVLEWVSGGAVIPTWQVTSFKLQHFREPKDIVYFIFILIVPLYFVYFTVFWVVELYWRVKTPGDKWYKHFFNFWNVIEVLTMMVIFISFVCRIMLYSHQGKNLDVTRFEYPAALEEMALLQRVDNAASAFFCLLAWFRIFKYFSLNDRLNLLSVTVSESVFELVMVGITLFVVVTAFSVSGYVIFGYDMYEYRDFLSSYASLFKLLLGEFDYVQLRAENRSLFPYHYIAFVITGAFVTLNMFLAVINDHFAEANKLVLDSDFGYDPQKLFKRALREAKRRLTLKDEKGEASQVAKVHGHVDQGDDALIERLKTFQESKGTPKLTMSDLSSALGGKPPAEILKRVMRRFDDDNSGTIEIQELERKKREKTPSELWKEASKKIAIASLFGEALSEEKQQHQSLEDRLDSFETKLDQLVQKLTTMTQQPTTTTDNILQQDD